MPDWASNKDKNNNTQKLMDPDINKIVNTIITI